MGRNEMQSLFDAVKGMAEQDGCGYHDKWQDRDELLAFMDDNEWFHSPHLEKDGVFLVLISDEMRAALDIWLKAYRKTDREKTEILMALLETGFPGTGKRFRKYILDSGNCHTRSAWKVLDFMLSVLKKELDAYSEDEIHALVASAYGELKMKELSLFSAFLAYGGAGSAYTDWKYRFESRQIIKADNTAYGIENFALMAYIVLNRESWEDNRLIEKALDNRRHAQLADLVLCAD